MAVLVFADIQNNKITKSSQEAVYYAHKHAAASGDEVIAVSYGNADDSEYASLGNFGASKVLVNKSINEINPTALVGLMADSIQETGAKVIVFSQDYTGKTIAPMLSARIKAGLVAGAVDLPDTSNGFVVKKTVFSGKAFAMVKVNSEIKIVAVVPNAFGKEEVGGSANVQAVSFGSPDSRIRVKESKAAVIDGEIPLTEADIVVSAGRGLKGPENWGMIEELARELGAATACSRPVADIGWRPHHEHVGQTGIAIRPNLYFAIGISGAIQHLAGVNGSKVIVVINTDPEAPFFKAADYGIVGDAFTVVPKLIEAVKKFKTAG